MVIGCNKPLIILFYNVVFFQYSAENKRYQTAGRKKRDDSISQYKKRNAALDAIEYFHHKCKDQ